MPNREIFALNTWTDIEKTYGEQINFVYQGNNIVGLHGYDGTDAINYVETLRSRLERYQNVLEEEYGLRKYKKTSDSRISIKLSYIYVMLNERDGYYKIGRSLNPCFREKTLQSEVPQVVNIFTSSLTYQANEQKLHKIFSEKRVRGEWFKLDGIDLTFIRNFDYSVKNG